MVFVFMALLLFRQPDFLTPLIPIICRNVDHIHKLNQINEFICISR